MTLILLALGGLAVILLMLGHELWRIAEALEALAARQERGALTHEEDDEVAA